MLDRLGSARDPDGEGGEGASRPHPAVARPPRVRVDGKFFARGGERLRLQGVTYGPFAPDADGVPFPGPLQIADDLARMRAAGINSLRTYHAPPRTVLDLADEHGMGVFVDVPWSKHLCFLDSRKAQAQARNAVRRAAQAGGRHPSVVAYSIANEIAPNIVRWHGARRIERFLAELRDVAKQADPQGLVTYTSYPSTEYLDLSFFDFATFNVYLHDLATFHRYLLRLQNLVGDQPLVLGELGMDTLRHGEREQARFLAGHLREAILCGVAGTFVFSWTDDWHTGGFDVQNWAFGITDRRRSPKASYDAIQQVFTASPAECLTKTPCVSVVVCTHNGARTLDSCLRSLTALDYPDYELIVVNDGSTDGTASIIARYPGVRAIHQANRGLSVARNVGLEASSGAIVAYTDDDCIADRDWLTQLVARLEESGAAAVGGPNLTPDDGRRAACVAASPGQPTHVLISDQVAEHIPGCNMAFRRQALVALNGFDPVYRKAGDDVDLCWRLQQAGHWITFAPGAFVWHHRRQNARAYLQQQAGYGEAEALLRFKHPDKFNGRGDGKWGGVLYGVSLRGLRLGQSVIYRGPLASAPFQCLYRPAPAHWAMLPSTLEWHFVAAGLATLGLLAPRAWIVSATMLLLSLSVALAQTVQARLAPRYDGLRSRFLVFLLCYVQPLIRSWKRHRTRLLAYHPPLVDDDLRAKANGGLPLSGSATVAYWTGNGSGRLELLRRVFAYLTAHRWGRALDSGWSDWDLEIHCHPGTVVQVRTAEEDHGSGQLLTRVHFRLRWAGYPRLLALGALASGLAAAVLHLWPAALGAGLLATLSAVSWCRGAYRAGLALAVFDATAEALGMSRCPATTESE